MGEMSIRKKNTFLTWALIAVMTVFIIYTVYLLTHLDTGSRLLRWARITYHELEEQIGQGNMAALEAFRGMYVKNDGYIEKSSFSDYQEGTYTSLAHFSSVAGLSDDDGKQYYTAPVLINGTAEGILIVEMEQDKESMLCRYGVLPFVPLLLLAGAAFVFLVVQKRMLKRDFFRPVEELLTVTRSIRREDFTTKLTYDYSGEIGSLCHEVEALRDELAFARKSAQQLQKNEKELLACISHDLKTPLASVSGYVEGIRSKVVTERAEIDRYLDIVIAKVKFISRLMDDILEQSKAELKEFPVVPGETYARRLFGEIFNDVSLDVVKAGYTFTCGEIPDVMVYADKSRLTQVVQNIISNSMKYTGSGGIISAELMVHGRELVISIKDNGSGIAVNDQPFIFDKFYRGEKERNMDIPGSGLGLSIARYIVESHGGKIECDSILSVGTVVRFSVPLC